MIVGDDEEESEDDDKGEGDGLSHSMKGGASKLKFMSWTWQFLIPIL